MTGRGEGCGGVRVARVAAPAEAARVSEAIRTGLVGANLRSRPEATAEALVVAAWRGDALVGGLEGRIAWSWLRIDRLWVDERARREGVGSWLLREAERLALDAGAIGAHLDSFGFQGPGFYQRRGYRTLGALADYPPGDQHLFLWKRLQREASQGGVGCGLVHFVRHGESEANVERVVANRGLTHPLTSTGRAQARAVAETLRREGITRVVSSPLLRALETSTVIAHALEVPLEVDDALREVDLGDLEGRGDADTWDAWARYGRSWLEPGATPLHPPGGEPLERIAARFGGLVAGLRARAAAGQGPVVCVGHGALYRTMLPRFVDALGADDLRARGGVANGGRVVLDVRDAPARLVAWHAGPDA